jgi:hypothetical protein
MRFVYAFFVLFLSFLHCEEASLAAELPSNFDGLENIQPDKLPPNEKQAAVQHEARQLFSLMPHKAEYEIVFDAKKSKAAGVKDVTGKSTIEIIKTKEGWSYKQQLSVQITYDNGATTVVEKDIATWESPTETSFHVEDRRDGSEPTVFEGQAEYNENVGWQVSFTKPPQDGFITAKKLLFPIGHLESTLIAIRDGKKGLSDQVVFDAGCGIQEPVRIDTVIVPLKTKELAINDKRYQTWRLQQALYDFKSQNPVPDYAPNNLEITANGVMASMETSWDEGIVAVLKLQSLTFYQ